MPHIIGPSRITNDNPSLIDNLFFNNSYTNCTNGNLLYKLSDQLPSFLITDNGNYKIINKYNNFVRDMSKFSQKKFNSALQTPQLLQDIKATKDTNDKYEILHKHIINTLDDLAPYKKITKREHKQKLKPWITPGILKSITKKKFFTNNL